MKPTLEPTFFNSPGASLERERAKERDTVDEAWTLTLAHTLLEQRPQWVARTMQALVKEPEQELVQEPLDETPVPLPARAPPPGGELASAAADREASVDGRTRPGSGAPASELPAQLSTEVSDARFGRLTLHIARGCAGLDIVINVADAHVKAMIEADQASLLQSLKAVGLRVASVQIGSTARAGTLLAPDRRATERARGGASFPKPAARWRTYQGSLEDEGDDDPDAAGVDLTA